MRKILSLLLAASVLFGCILSLPLNIFADQSEPLDITITFDESYYTSLSDNQNGVIRRIGLVEDTAGNNAIKFNRVVSNTDSSNNANQWKYAYAVRLYNPKTNGALELTSGTEYSFTYDIKKLSDHRNEAFDIILAMVPSTNDLSDFNFKNFPGQVIATESAEFSNTAEWETEKTVQFTSNATGEAVLVLRHSHAWYSESDIRFDNIKIKEKDAATSGGKGITFDENYYNDPPSSVVSRATIITDEVATHGKVIKYGQIASSNTSSTNQWNPNYAHAFRLVGSDGNSPLTLEEGKTYDVSYDIKKVNAPNAFKVELIMVSSSDDLSNIKLSGYNHELLANEAAETNGNWKENVTTTFTAQNSGEAIMVLYHQDTSIWGRTDSADVRFDNIKITESTGGSIQKPPVDSTITFSETYYPAEADYQAYYGASIIDDEIAEHGKVIEYNKIHAANTNNANNGYRWPNATRLVNSATNEPIKFEAGKSYSVSYDIKKVNVVDNVDFNVYFVMMGTGSGINDLQYGTYTGQIVTEESGANADWTTVTTKFIALTSGEPVMVLRMKDKSQNYRKNDCDIRFDNIIIKEQEDDDSVAKIVFDTKGGNTIPLMVAVANVKVPSLPVPEKDGSVFAGWYTDEDCTVPYAESVVAGGTTNLYAKWETKATTATEFKTGFELEEYGGVSPYVNHNTTSATDKTGNVNTTDVRHITDDESEANSGNGRLYFDNETGEHISESDVRLSAALINTDGNYYQVVKGQRYQIDFSAKFNGSSKSHQIDFVTTSATSLTTMNKSNTKTVYSFINSGAADMAYSEWYANRGYFVAEETEKLFVVAYSPDAKTSIDIDDIVIKPVDETVAPIIEFYNEDNSLLNRLIGEPGSWFIESKPNGKSGHTFVGWFDEDGKQFVTNKFPKNDVKLYPKYVPTEATDNPSSDFSKTVVANFESNAAKAYYSQDAYGPSAGMCAVVDDPENAYSGNGYYKYTGVGHWMQEWYRTMRFYDDNSVGKFIRLEPETNYRVTYRIKVDSITGAANLWLVGFNDEYKNSGVETEKYGYTIFSENYFAEGSRIEDYGKYVLYETIVITGDLPVDLGLVLYGGYFTACIDEVTVDKLKTVTVTYDSNGGSAVDKDSLLSYNTTMQPLEPEKAGYVFDGWYSDKGLTKKFDFNNTLITEDITLYAKWSVKEEATPIYKDEITYTYTDETVELVPEDAELDNSVEFKDKDKIGQVKADKQTNTDAEDGFNWWIIVITVAAVLVLAAVIITVIIIKRRKS